MDNTNNICQNELAISKQYQDIVDVTNIVSKTDIGGNITYVNSRFLDISGYSEEELIGRSHNIVRDPDAPSSLFREMWITIQSKRVWHGVVTNSRKDGTKYTVNATIFPILDSNSEIVEYISIRHDITKLLELSNRLEEINKYNATQEHLAREKLEAGIVNEIDCSVLHHASDILSGDFYSTYKMKDGSTFIYLIDGQGHGISPALTVFAISSMLNKFIYDVKTIKELIEKLYPEAKTFLAEVEQLSYTMIMISSDKKSIEFSSGGMYPILIKKGDEIIRLKANNTPFMNFSDMPVCDKIELDSWDALMIYSDGIIEEKNKELLDYMPNELIKNPSAIKESFQTISSYDFEDDVTILCLENSE
ncbi:PAS domain S-box protein [Sulfurimonas sp.]